MRVNAWAYMAIERVAGLAKVGGVAAVLLAVPVTVGAQSPCKGLSETQCKANKACRWMPARIAGQTKNKRGELHKSSAKAHCRLGARKSS